MASKIPFKKFEDWCLSESLPGPTTIDIRSVRQHANNPPIKDLMQLFIDKMRAASNSGPLDIHINLNKIDRNIPVQFDLTHTLITEPSFGTNINSLNVQSVKSLSILGGCVRTISLNNIPDTILSNMYINRLDVGSDVSSLTITNCIIGTLAFNASSTRSLTIEGGRIHCVECSQPKINSPFSGSVVTSDVEFVSSQKKSRIFKGAQQFHNLRSHLEQLENSFEAGKMRTLELSADHEHENGVIWLASEFQRVFSDYGQSPGKPLFIALIFFIGSAVIILQHGYAIPGLAVDSGMYTGWRSVLLENNIWGQLSRSFILPMQSFLNPLGVFGTRTLVVASNGLVQIAMNIQGLFIDLMIAMTFLAIRKRFKIS